MHPCVGDKFEALKPMGAVIESDVIEITETSCNWLIGKSNKYEGIQFSWEDFNDDKYLDKWHKL